ncbi:bifunctional hydroxymethylpyrimidine kinase/phosphomethylpyrimidine kinase [Fredinandcohnia humi]
MKEVPISFTIARTYPTGVAGILADLKTFQELQVFDMSVITTIVSQIGRGNGQLIIW